MTNVLLRSVWTRIFRVPILSTGNLCPSGVSLLYGRSGGRQEAWGRRRSLSHGVRPSMMSHKGIIRLECSLTLRYEVDSWPTFRSFYPTFYSYELMHRSWLKVCQRGRSLRGRRKWHTAVARFMRWFLILIHVVQSKFTCSLLILFSFQRNLPKEALPEEDGK